MSKEYPKVEIPPDPLLLYSSIQPAYSALQHPAMSDLWSQIQEVAPVNPLRAAADRAKKRMELEPSQFASIDELRGQLGVTMPSETAEYREKMMHPMPDQEVVDRVAYILQQCAGKRVLNLGSTSGDLQGKIKEVAKHVIGVDKVGSIDAGTLLCDLDATTEKLHLNVIPNSIDLIVAGEIFEHLANPGNLLAELRRFQAQLLVTVPNAFSLIAQRHMSKGWENVNKDHVCWYSYTTLKTLLFRYQFEIEEFRWYNGVPLWAEGLIVLAR